MSESPAPDPRRHLVLGCFCFHSFIQCFCFMDFSTVSELDNDSLDMHTEVLDGLLYYGGFAATLPAMWLSMWMLLGGHDWAAGLSMSVLVVLGAWLRVAAVYATSYVLGLLSTVCLGLAGGVIFTSFTFIPERWFPPGERAFATALAVQSNYAGWALGCLNPIMLGSKTIDEFKTFLWVQGIITSLALPFHFLANTRGPQRVVPTETGAPEPVLSIKQTIVLLSGRPQYIIHSTAYAMLGAVGYAVTGVVDSCFEAALPQIALYNATTGLTTYTVDGFTSNQTMCINVIFVVSGVITGLVVGRVVPDEPAVQAVAVRSLAIAGGAALLTVQIVLLAANTINSKDLIFGLVLMLMCLAGAGSLGFIGVGMRVAITYSHPAQEVYAGSVIEFFLLGGSTLLGLLTYVVPANATFWFFAIPACTSAVIICAFARFRDESTPSATSEPLINGAQE